MEHFIIIFTKTLINENKMSDSSVENSIIKF